MDFFADNPMLLFILVGIGLTVLIFIIRYVIRTIFNKAEDAIHNKLADRKNESSREENLADRYKK